MSKGTLLYMGGFVLPDKSASANRVVSNGKLFSLSGYKTVFSGRQEDAAFPFESLEGYDNMFCQPQPRGTREWISCMLDLSVQERLVEEIGDVKAVILYNMPFVTLLKAKRLFRKKGIKVAYDCTEWTRDTDGSLPKRLFKIIDEFFVSHFAHKVADGMIVISEMMKKAYRKCDNLILLPPLVDTDEEIWHQDRKKGDVFEFCFAGIPDGNKERLDIAVQGFEGLENARLRLVGLTGEDFEKLYPHISLKNNDRIVFEGRVSHKEAIGYILGCDCYIFIRQSDRRNNAGFPTKLSESFTCNIPIITTDVSDVKKYIIEEGKGEVLASLSVSDIHSAMKRQLALGRTSGNQSLNEGFCYKSYEKECRCWLENLMK